ncbi:MAG: MXAN_5187 C-terminal domain-containing protein [Acidobacteriota bacterium]
MSLEQDLKRIDAEIRKLKIAYDLYFVGASPRPPTDLHDSVDKMIKRLQNVSMRNLADRFLYSGLVNKFNAFSELWNKGIRNREEGARVHPLAARAALRAARTETGGTSGPPGGAGPGRGARGRLAPAADTWRIPASGRDEASLKRLYECFIAAKDTAGDSRKPSFDAFSREIAKHTAALRVKVDCEAIDFRIYCKDNKVSIKAKPIK